MKRRPARTTAGGGPAYLLVDAGNTRLKACLLADGRCGPVCAQPWKAGGEARAVRALLRAVLAGGDGVAGVLACSVAGAKLEKALTVAARAVGAGVPQFVRSSPRAAGVRNGYDEAWRLGADRFVALIGARALHPGRALCLVDAGTALTIDLVDAAGTHRGGLLVPGPSLMVSSLLGQTAGIRRRAGAGDVFDRVPVSVFGRSTRAGLASGALLASAALIERAVREARAQLGQAPLLLVSGGAAPIIAPRLHVPALLGDGLVFAGLAALARQSAQARESL